MKSSHSTDDPRRDVDGPNARELWKRSERVLPGGGIFLTRSAEFAGRGVLPGFIDSGEGCRVTDADGHSYIDFLCANGPILLGYRHPEVEEVARAQAAVCDSASLYPSALIEFAEFITDRTPGMDWAITAKNGSDVVALACRAARSATGRSKIIQFVNAYHGFAPELVPFGGGVPAEHRASVVRVPWNDAEGLARAAEEHGKDLAAIVLNPIDQNPFHDTVDPDAGFVAAIDDVRKRTGARVVFDDVRHGFRIHPGGSQVAVGIQPDFICLGKGLGNGHAISVLLGSDDMREGTRRLMFTATFCFGMVSMRAAQKTVEIYDRDRIFETMSRSGRRLGEGIVAAAAKTGHRISWTGPAAMPTLRFVGDDDLAIGKRWSTEAARRGAIFHPCLNWFLNGAHDDDAIDEAVEIATAAFEATPLPEARDNQDA